jgi:RHS repeat-associated protein
MTYDPENRLTVFSQAGTTVVEYGYADDGTRLWKRVNQDQNQLQVWIGKIYEEKNDTQVPPVNHTLFHVFADDQQVCTFETGSPLAGGGDATKVGYYYHKDNLNSSSVLSDSGGSQTEINLYYPFGRTQPTTPVKQASFQVSRRFTGQVLDAESALYYYNARYYDPELGRFIQPDTIIPDLSNPQSYNRYSYVCNNPINRNDPLGRFGVEADSSSGGVTGVPNVTINVTSDGHVTYSNNDSPEALRVAILGGAAFTAVGLTVIGAREAPALTAKVLLALLGYSQSQNTPDPCPQKVKDTLKYINENGQPPPGYVGGREFKNNEGLLPEGGNYVEYDVDPKPTDGTSRNAERIVVDENTGQAWYTDDHYQSFIEITDPDE